MLAAASRTLMWTWSNTTRVQSQSTAIRGPYPRRRPRLEVGLPCAVRSPSMSVLGGIVGAVLGFFVGIVFTEVIFVNNQSWPDVVPFALAVIGAFVGSSLGRRARSRRALS